MTLWKSVVYSALLTSLLSGCAPKSETGYSAEKGYYGNISLSGAFALYPIVVLWAEDFKAEHPNVRFNISAGGAGKGIADALTGMVDIGLVSRDIHPQELKKNAYPIHVAKDAVVCTFNKNHVNYALLKERGLTQEEMENIFVHKKYTYWSDIDPRLTRDKIITYVRSDAAGAAETWANFFKQKQEDLQGIGIFGDPGLAQAIKDNKSSIGFNNINYVYDLKTKKTADKIAIIPLDSNNDGKIDSSENFYATIDDLTDAIATHKYPSPPARDLTFVTHGKPTSKLLIKFIEFVLSKQSQGYLLANGYVPLNDKLKDIELKKIH